MKSNCLWVLWEEIGAEKGNYRSKMEGQGVGKGDEKLFNSSDE